MRASGSGGWLEEVSAFEGFVRGWVGEGRRRRRRRGKSGDSWGY